MSEPTPHTITVSTAAANANPYGDATLLLTSEVATMLGTSSRHVQMQTESGNLPFSLTPGGHRRIALADVLSAVRSSGIPGFQPGDTLVRLSVAADMCSARASDFKEGAEAIGVPLGRTIGAKKSTRGGHLRVMQRDIERVRQQLLCPARQAK